MRKYRDLKVSRRLKRGVLGEKMRVHWEFVTRGWKTVQSSLPLTPNLLLEFEVFEVNNDLVCPDTTKTKLLRAARNSFAA